MSKIKETAKSPSDYDLFEDTVEEKVGSEKFEAWADSMGEHPEDWFKRWMQRLPGNTLARGSLLAEIACEAIENYANGINAGIERARNALDEAEL